MNASQTVATEFQSLTRDFAALCSGMTWDTMPAGVQERAKLIVFDTLGAMLSASRPSFPGTRRLSEFVRDESGDGACVVVGTNLRGSPTAAALMNGYLGYALDIESHHGPAVVHAAAAVLPAALAVAPSMGATGAGFLASVVLGIEVACRVSLALGPNDLYHRTFHPTAIAGSFGAAAAASALLKLDGEGFDRALGLAATMTGGLLAWASDESEESRPLNPGLAARNGVTAARLAALDFGAPRGVLDPDAKYNVYRAWSLDGAGDPARLLAGFGESFAIAELTIKQHACCAFLHPAVDGLLDILASERVTADDIAALTIRFPRAGAPMIDANPLRSHRAQYILPVAAVRGHVRFEDVLHDRSAEPEIRRLAEATTFIPDDELDPLYPERYTTVIEVATQDGTAHTRRVDWARGTPENRMSGDEIVAKFRTLAGQRLDRAEVERIVATVERLDQVTTLDDLVHQLSVPSERGPVQDS